MKDISKFDNYEDENFEDETFDEIETLKNKNPKRKFIIIGVLIFLVAAFCFSFYYYDTHFGQGIINGYLNKKGINLTSETTENTEDTQDKTDSENNDETKTANAEVTDETTENTEEDKFLGEEISSKKPTLGKEVLTFDEGNVLGINTVNNSYYVCSKDGMKFFDSNGDQVFNDTYTLNYPVSVFEANYAAVYESSGTNVRVYNEKGFIYSVASEYPISKVKLNKNGYLAIIMRAQDSCKTVVYNSEGNKLMERKEDTKGVYPVDLDISDDNKVLCVSYLDTSDVYPISRLVFFYINKEDSMNVADGIFSAVQKDDIYAISVNCMENNTFFIASDVSLMCFSSAGEEIFTKELQEKISAYDVFGKSYAVIGYDGLLPESGENKYSLEVVDLSGKTVSLTSLKDPISYIKSDNKNFVVKTGNSLYGYNKNGKEQYNLIPPYDIKDVSFFNGKSDSLILSATSIEIADLSKVNTSKEDTPKE